MAYGAIRLLMGALIFALGWMLIRKKRPKNQRRGALVLLIATLVLTVLSFMFPIENAIISFSSPEAAHSYFCSDPIKLVLDGKETTLVISGDQDSNNPMILPKQDSGWKIGRSLDTKTVTEQLTDGHWIFVYRYKDTGDFYVGILNTSAEPLEITDDRDTRYISLENGALSQLGAVSMYYAYISDLTFPYSITINGEVISVGT